MVSCTICSSYETVVRLHPNAQLRHAKFKVVACKNDIEEIADFERPNIFLCLSMQHFAQNY